MGFRDLGPELRGVESISAFKRQLLKLYRPEKKKYLTIFFVIHKSTVALCLRLCLFFHTFYRKYAYSCYAYKKIVYCANFLPNLANISYPLRMLTQQGVAFMWGKDQEKTFTELKKMITEAPVLSLNDPSRGMKVVVNTCQNGLCFFRSPQAMNPLSLSVS